jgi:hypothetical protein
MSSEPIVVGVVPDIRVQILYGTFLAHGLSCCACLALSVLMFFFLPPMTTQPNQHVVLALVSASVLFALLYLGMCVAAAYKKTRFYLPLYVPWVLCGSVMVGCSAVLLKNTAPLQLVAMVLAETTAVIVYSRCSPRFIATGYAILLMSTAGLVTWGASVALLVFYRDWLPGTMAFRCASPSGTATTLPATTRSGR